MAYGHREMAPCHCPAPQDMLGAKLNKEALKYKMKGSNVAYIKLFTEL